jgi:hypothetical protein
MVRTPTQPLDRMSCASESFLTAQSSGASSLVWIDANHDHDLRVFALDENGQRVHARDLARGWGGAVAGTGGTPLVVTHADTGECLDVYLPEDGLHHTGQPNE